MNMYTIPVVLTTSLNLVIAGVAWLFRRQEPMNRAFAIFTFALAMENLASYGIMQSGGALQLGNWIVILTFASIGAFLAAFYFVLTITGYIENLNKRIIGVPIRYFLYFLIVTIMTLIPVMIWTDLILIEVEHTPTGLSAIYGPYRPVFTIYFFIVLVYLAAILFTAMREIPRGPRRRLVRYVNIALGVYYFSGPLFEYLLVQFGMNYQFMTFVAGFVATLIFYLALLRYQFDQVEHLNVTLEHRVEERTRSLRDAQVRLVQSGKMVSLGRLVSGVAHELNTPVGAVQSSAVTLSRGLEKLRSGSLEENARQRIELSMSDGVRVIEEGTKRVGEIVKRLRAFAQLDEAVRQHEKLTVLVDETLDMIVSTCPETIGFEKHYDDVPPIDCYPAEINQILHSVILNAVEAVGEQGVINIHVLNEKDACLLTVEDDGCGISKNNLEHVFDPGFTTKGRGIGTGLGLSIAYQGMEHHGGMIDITSRFGEGTTVTLRFPLKRMDSRI